MNLKPDLRQTTSLVLSPRVQQTLKVLQLSSLDLQQALTEEIAQNPLLDAVDDITEAEDGERLDSLERELEQAEREPTDSELADPEMGSDSEPASEIDWSAFVEDDLYRQSFGSYESNPDFLERVPVARETLAEHLVHELHLLALPEEDLALGEVIIASLDDRGYLATPVEELADFLQTSPDQVKRILAIVQTLDPAGAGARDLRECLLIQLRARGEEGNLAWRIVEEQFENLKKNRKADIARALNADPVKVQKALDSMGRLSTRPGVEVSAEEVRYIVPDLVVSEVGGEFVVRLDDRGVPRLRINTTYEAILTGGKARATEIQYLTRKLEAARSWIHDIEVRRRTLTKVMTCIIKEQRQFFDKGIHFLRPLRLDDIARQVGVSESTVSRATRRKYVQTPRGVFELKFFFSGGVTNEQGEDVSARAIRERIRNLIAREDPREPLSDSDIAEILHDEGLPIARRTVAKYRQRLRILPAHFRRRV